MINTIIPEGIYEVLEARRDLQTDVVNVPSYTQGGLASNEQFKMPGRTHYQLDLKLRHLDTGEVVDIDLHDEPANLIWGEKHKSPPKMVQFYEVQWGTDDGTGSLNGTAMVAFRITPARYTQILIERQESERRLNSE